MSDTDYDHYLAYYTEQKGQGLGYYSGRQYVSTGQDGDGLGDIFAAAKPALFRLAKSAGKRILSAGASVLRDAISGNDVKKSAKNAFSSAGLELLDDVVSSPQKSKPRRGKRGKVTKTKKKPKQKGGNIFH